MLAFYSNPSRVDTILIVTSNSKPFKPLLLFPITLSLFLAYYPNS